MNEECVPGHGRDCMCDECREWALGSAVTRDEAASAARNEPPAPGMVPVQCDSICPKCRCKTVGLCDRCGGSGVVDWAWPSEVLP